MNHTYKQQPLECPYCDSEVLEKTGSLHLWETKYKCGYSVVGCVGEDHCEDYKPCRVVGNPFELGKAIAKLVERHNGLSLLKEHYKLSDTEISQAMKQGILDLIESKIGVYDDHK